LAVLLLVEEFVYDGEVLFLVAHPGSVSGSMERVHAGLPRVTTSTYPT
jgi:hypothetical protein